MLPNNGTSKTPTNPTEQQEITRFYWSTWTPQMTPSEEQEEVSRKLWVENTQNTTESQVLDRFLDS